MGEWRVKIQKHAVDVVPVTIKFLLNVLLICRCSQNSKGMDEMSRWLSSSSFLFWCRKLNCNHCKLQVFCQTFAISVSGDLSSEVSSNYTHEDKVKMFSVVTVHVDCRYSVNKWNMWYKLLSRYPDFGNQNPAHEAVSAI